MALMYGDIQIIEATEDVFIFLRSYFHETAILVVNNSNEEKAISFNAKVNSKETFKTVFNSELINENVLFEIKLKANSFDIITN